MCVAKKQPASAARATAAATTKRGRRHPAMPRDHGMIVARSTRGPGCENRAPAPPGTTTMFTFLRWFVISGVTGVLVLVFLDTAEGKRLFVHAGSLVQERTGSDVLA